MKVLIACEHSGTVREAFRARGHDAYSCDILPASDGSIYHLCGDVHQFLNGFDLMKWDAMIGHPPCTYLTNSAEWAYGDGPYHQKVKPKTLVGAARRAAREEAAAFFLALWESKIPRIAIENPIGYMSRRIEWAQIIHPYQFGDDASKATCLWLKGLPKLAIDPAKRKSGRVVEWPKSSGKMVERWANQTDAGQNRLSPSDDRGHLRAITYSGIANAMAEQWSIL